MKHKQEHEESITSPRHSKKKVFVWQMISGVLLAALIITLLFAIAKPKEAEVQPITDNVILTNTTNVDQKIVTETMNFLKEAFSLPNIEVKETVIEDGLYKTIISLEGQEMPIHYTLSGDNIIIPGTGLLNKKEALIQIEEAKKQEEAQANVKVAENYRINTNSTMNDFLGKPSVIFFVGTYCGHCQAMIPEYKAQLWDNYKDSANLWLNVIDNKRFVVDEIAQGYNQNLNYDTIAGEPCEFIPSVVVLDKDGKVVLKSCGSEKGIADIKSELDKLLK